MSLTFLFLLLCLPVSTCVGDASSYHQMVNTLMDSCDMTSPTPPSTSDLAACVSFCDSQSACIGFNLGGSATTCQFKSCAGGVFSLSGPTLYRKGCDSGSLGITQRGQYTCSGIVLSGSSCSVSCENPNDIATAAQCDGTSWTSTGGCEEFKLDLPMCDRHGCWGKVFPKNHWGRIWKPWRHNRCHRKYYECMEDQGPLPDYDDVGELFGRDTCTLDGGWFYTKCWQQFYAICQNWPKWEPCHRGCVTSWRDQYEEHQTWPLWENYGPNGNRYSSSGGRPYHGIFGQGDRLRIRLPCLNPIHTGIVVQFQLWIGSTMDPVESEAVFLSVDGNEITRIATPNVLTANCGGWTTATSTHPFTGAPLWPGSGVCSNWFEAYIPRGDRTDSRPRLEWYSNQNEPVATEWWGVGNIMVHATMCASEEVWITGQGCMPALSA